MGKLFFVSIGTLSILLSFVFTVVILALLYADAFSLGFAIVLTIMINVILWIVGPFISDWINKWFYKVTFIKSDQVKAQYPQVYELINSICTEKKFPFPKIGIIPDNNPTAYAYGSGRWNSRIIITNGIFHFLSPQEANAVIAHEMGHIVNRDFIVMMIASTLVQILYELYAALIRVKGRRAGGLRIVAIVSYVLYLIGTYILYYLSRTRESLADEFSASRTSAQDLAVALIKIGYGIVTTADSDSTKRLLQSTRHLGIIDVKNAKGLGTTAYITNNNPDMLAEVMVFDAVSPWAKLIELGSTHPLTGRRIGRLSDISKKTGKAFSFDVKGAIARLAIDRKRLYSGFFLGAILYFAPVLGALVTLLIEPKFVLVGVAAGLILKALYKFSATGTVATTILDEMRNPYASPLRGKPITLTGQVIGKGVAGYVFGEDMMYQDKTGITYMDYSSIFGFVGDFFFALGKMKKIMQVDSTAQGWFFRGMSSYVSLKYIKTETMRVNSHPLLWALVPPVLLIGVTFYLQLVYF